MDDRRQQYQFCYYCCRSMDFRAKTKQIYSWTAQTKTEEGRQENIKNSQQTPPTTKSLCFSLLQHVVHLFVIHYYTITNEFVCHLVWFSELDSFFVSFLLYCIFLCVIEWIHSNKVFLFQTVNFQAAAATTTTITTITIVGRKWPTVVATLLPIIVEELLVQVVLLLLPVVPWPVIATKLLPF